jgi:hypothetical protein
MSDEADFEALLETDIGKIAATFDSFRILVSNTHLASTHAREIEIDKTIVKLRDAYFEIYRGDITDPWDTFVLETISPQSGREADLVQSAQVTRSFFAMYEHGRGQLHVDDIKWAKKLGELMGDAPVEIKLLRVPLTIKAGDNPADVYADYKRRAIASFQGDVKKPTRQNPDRGNRLEGSEP